jgi:ABC-2 type transport system permease protein
VSSYATRILARYSAELARELRPSGRTVRAGAPPPSSRVPRIDVRTRGWYNPDLQYSHFMVPGILVVLVTMVATTVAAMNIVREKEIGTLEQLNVTPLGRGHFVAGKLIPFWIIAMIDLAIGLTLARLVFGVPVRGSLLLVFGGAAVYLLAALGIGLWISTAVQTQQQAMFLSFALNMIYLLMSGLFTPLRSMPTWAQWMAEFSPVKHFLVIMRAVLVKGAGLAEVSTPLLLLAAYGLVVFTLAMRQYHKTTA